MQLMMCQYVYPETLNAFFSHQLVLSESTTVEYFLGP